MTFKVGDTVVYPHHGAALIEAVEVRVIKGAEKEYLVLRVAQGDLTVRVPADNVDLVGVRDVVNAEGLDRVFEVLRQPYTEEPTNWSRRYKANLEKLASGDVIKVAEVVREFHAEALEMGDDEVIAGTLPVNGWWNSHSEFCVAPVAVPDDATVVVIQGH